MFCIGSIEVSIVLVKVVYLLQDVYYHAKLQDPPLSGTGVTPVSEVPTTTLLHGTGYYLKS
jgi:hypothetical protein